MTTAASLATARCWSPRPTPIWSNAARASPACARGFWHEELLDASALQRLVPALSGACRSGMVSRSDGAAIPLRATQAFKRKAVALGARLHEGLRVQRVQRVQRADAGAGKGAGTGADWRVYTGCGSFSAPHLVNAAGAWADRIAADLGEPVPLGTCLRSGRGRAKAPSGGLRRCDVWPCLRLWAAHRALHPIGEWAFARLPDRS